jgi:hypothetical protein
VSHDELIHQPRQTLEAFLGHSAITEACKAAQANGMGLEEVLDFSRHRDIKVLMVYRDRERDVQGQLAAFVAAATV